MRVLKLWAMAGVTAALAFAAPAMAQNCTPFTDVTDDGPPPAGVNCPAVQWLYNRNITTGFTATTYNSGAPVSRLAMALFLYRMGQRLTPVEIAASANPAGRQDISGSPILCVTNLNPFTVTGYPRRATFNNKVNVYDPSADVELRIDVMSSIDNGVNWASVAGTQTYQTLRATGVGVVIDDVSMYPLGAMDLTVGQTYIFGIRVARQGGTGNPYIYCENRVSIANRNSLVAPYDEPEREGRAATLPPQ